MTIDARAIQDIQKGFKGKISSGERLARHTSFGIGGKAELWLEPTDVRELRRIVIASGRTSVPLFVIGTGTNILANDDGVSGFIVHLGAAAFNGLWLRGMTVRVGSGYMMTKLVRWCCAQGLGGLESLVGIPGTVGGAVYMNAGGSGNPIFKNIGDSVRAVKIMDRMGKVSSLKRSDLVFGYRRTNLDGMIVLEVTLALHKSDPDVLKSDYSKFLKMKWQKQALDRRSAGCVFKNPKDFQFTCGQMIDMLGLKGARIGDAEVSEKHANFIVNRGGASACDVVQLIDLVKKKVRESYDVDLELEIQVI